MVLRPRMLHPHDHINLPRYAFLTQYIDPFK
jgi:hypothetical protein